MRGGIIGVGMGFRESKGSIVGEIWTFRSKSRNNRMGMGGEEK